MPDDLSDRACHCPLCSRDGDLTDQRPHVVDDVREYGWHVAGVAADDVVPGWAYTIGLWHTYRRPDLAVVGLPVETCMAVVNVVGDQVRAGTVLQVDQPMNGVLENCTAILRQIRLEWYRDFFGQAIEFYRKPPLPMLQICWPDMEERFAWEDGVQGACRDRQPQLWRPYADHPRGVWTSLHDEMA